LIIYKILSNIITITYIIKNMEYNKRFIKFGQKHIKINHISYYTEEKNLVTSWAYPSDCMIMLKNGTYISNNTKEQCAEIKKLLDIEQSSTDNREVC
jgi:hypothetical protein